MCLGLMMYKMKAHQRWGWWAGVCWGLVDFVEVAGADGL